MPSKNEYSFGDLVRITGLPGHRVRFIIQSRQIRPSGSFAGAAVYSEATLDAVKRAANSIVQKQLGANRVCGSN